MSTEGVTFSESSVRSESSSVESVSEISSSDEEDEISDDESPEIEGEEHDPLPVSGIAIVFIVICSIVLFGLVIFGFVAGILTIIFAQRENDPYFGSRVIYTVLPLVLGLLSFICFIITERILFTSKTAPNIDLPLGFSFVFAYFTVWSGSADVYVWISFLISDGKHGGYEYLPLTQLFCVICVLTLHLIYTKIRMKKAIVSTDYEKQCNLSYYFAAISFVIFSVLGLTLWPSTLKNYSTQTESFELMTGQAYSLVSTISVPTYLIASILVTIHSEYFAVILSLFWTVIITILSVVGVVNDGQSISVEIVYCIFIIFTAILVHKFKICAANALSTSVFISILVISFFAGVIHALLEGNENLASDYSGSWLWSNLLIFELVFVVFFVPAFIFGKAFVWPYAFTCYLVLFSLFTHNNPFFNIVNVVMVTIMYIFGDMKKYSSQEWVITIPQLAVNPYVVFFVLCSQIAFEVVYVRREYHVVYAVVLFVCSFVFSLSSQRTIFPLFQWTKNKISFRELSWKSLIPKSGFDRSFYVLSLGIFIVVVIAVPHAFSDLFFFRCLYLESPIDDVNNNTFWSDQFPSITVLVLLIGLLVSNIISQIPEILVMLGKKKKGLGFLECKKIEILHSVVISTILFLSMSLIKIMQCQSEEEVESDEDPELFGDDRPYHTNTLVMPENRFIFAWIVVLSYVASFQFRFVHGVLGSRIGRFSLLLPIIGCGILVFFTEPVFLNIISVILLVEVNLSSSKTRTKNFTVCSFVFLGLMLYEAWETGLWDIWFIFSVTNPFFGNDLRYRLPERRFFFFLPNPFESSVTQNLLWDFKTIAFVILGVSGSFISYSSLFGKMRKLGTDKNKKLKKGASKSLFQNPFLNNCQDFSLICVVLFLFSLMSSLYFVSNVFCLTCVILFCLYLHHPKLSQKDEDDDFVLSRFLFSSDEKMSLKLFFVGAIPIAFIARNVSFFVLELIHPQEYPWLFVLSIVTSSGLLIWVGIVSIPYFLRRFQAYRKMNPALWIATILNNETIDSLPNKEHEMYRKVKLWHSHVHRPLMSYLVGIFVEATRTVSVVGIIVGIVCATGVFWAGIVASVVYMVLIVVLVRGDYFFMHLFPFIFFGLRQLMIFFWDTSFVLQERNYDEFGILDVVIEVVWSLVPYLVPHLLLRFTNMFEFSSDHNTERVVQGRRLFRFTETGLRVMHWVLSELYFVVMLISVFVSSAMNKNLVGAPAFVASGICVMRAFIGFSLTHYILSSIFITLQLSYLVVYYPEWGHFPVMIANYVLSFIALSYFKVRATDASPKKEKNGDQGFSKIVKDMNKLSVIIGTYFSTAIVFFVPFTFMVASWDGVRLYFVFQMLFQVLGIWFSLFLGSYFAFFFYPLATTLFVFLQVMESSDLQWDDCLAWGLFAGWVHSFVMYVLSQTGVIYVLASRRARKLLFFPLEKVWGKVFNVPLRNVRQVDQLLKKFGPSSLYGLFFQKKVDKVQPATLIINNDENNNSTSSSVPSSAITGPLESKKKKSNEKMELEFSTFDEYFSSFADELRKNMLRSVKQSYFKNLTFFLLLQHSVLSFASYSFGFCSIISFFTCVAYFLFHRMLLWVLLSPIVFTSAIFVSFIRSHVLESGWGSEGQFFLFIPAGVALVVSSASVLIVVMSFVLYRKKFGIPSQEEGSSDEQKSDRPDVDDNDEQSETDLLTVYNDLEVVMDVFGDRLEDIPVIGDGYGSLVGDFVGKRKDDIKQFDFIKLFRFRSKTQSFLDSYRFQSWFFWFQTLYFTYFSIGCLFISLPLFYFSTVLIVVLFLVIGFVELFLSCVERDKNRRWRRAVGFGRILVGLISCTFILPTPEKAPDNIVSQEMFWVTFGVSLVVACIYGIFVSILYIYWLVKYLGERREKKVEEIKEASKALARQERRKKRKERKKRKKEEKESMMKKSSISELSVPESSAAQDVTTTETEASVVDIDTTDASEESREESESEMEEEEEEKFHVKGRKEKLMKMVDKNPGLFKMIVDDWSDKESELFELISGSSSASSDHSTDVSSENLATMSDLDELD